MQVDELLAQARDTITVKRVFGDPIERDGVTVIPVANVMGGAGTGEGPAGMRRGMEGSDEAVAAGPMPTGSGGGFGVRATPAGVYVIKGGTVRWEPAFDMNRAAMMGQLVGLVALLVIGSVIRARSKR